MHEIESINWGGLFVFESGCNNLFLTLPTRERSRLAQWYNYRSGSIGRKRVLNIRLNSLVIWKVNFLDRKSVV